MVLRAANSVWAFVPQEDLDKAKTVVDSAIAAHQILWLTSVEGMKIVVTSAAAEGLFGAASVTSGLSALGGDSMAAGGAGMAGGIVVVAAAPSLLTAHTIYNLCSAMENNSTTPTVVALSGAGGAVLGTSVGVVMVVESGTVAGLSASGITSGLAALGGGSVASGGAGMLGGLAAVVESDLKRQRSELLDLAVSNGFTILL